MKKSTLKKIIENGGATLDSNGKQMIFTNGFQCSKQDLFVFDVEDIDSITKIINNTLTTLANDDYLGLWVDDGKLYIDLSIRIEDRQEAIQTGKKYNQIALWDWKNQTSLYLATV